MVNGMSTSGGVQDTLRDMWETRPRRPRGEAKLAGVSVAIARRYGIDPVLLRVAFVVAVFAGGAGLALYLLGWLVLPPERPQVSGTTRNVLAVTGMVLLVIFGFPFAVAWMNSAGVLAFLGALVALYLVHRNYRDRSEQVTERIADAGPAEQPGSAGESADPDRPDAPRSADAEQPEQPEQPGEHGDAEAGAGAVGAADAGLPWHDADRTAPRSGDPGAPDEETDRLGAEHHGWDLAGSEPAAPKRHWITWTALALAVLAAAAAIAAGTEPRVVPAVALAVLGVGMVLGAFLRGGRGLIAFALPVGALALLIGTVHDLDERLERYDADRDAALERQGPQHVVATSPAQLDARYRGGNHPVSLDLRGLHLDEEQTTSVRTDSGPIQVLLPAGLPADVRCSSEHGPVRCLGAEVTGGEVTVTDHAADGAARGRANDRRPDDRGELGDEPAALRLELSSSNGPVEVRRG